METEGVIKFELEFAPDEAPSAAELGDLEGWRRLLHDLGVVGQDSARYGGLGFGNVSRRLPQGQFLISGTQTGGRARLGPEGYCRVLSCDPLRNRISARGRIRPSSEALTHGAVYAAAPTVGAVLHVHSPPLWQAAASLGLAATPAQVSYGTPAMAHEVARALADARVRQAGVLAMAGHEDGILAFGADPAEAGKALVGWLAAALAR